MAIESTSGPKAELQGLSSDTKPTAGVPVGSTFWELDTKAGYTFSPANIDATKAPTGWWLLT